MYALLESGSIKEYPYTYEQLKATKTNMSWPISMSVSKLAEYNVVPVIVNGGPEFNRNTHALRELIPVYVEENDRWEQVWEVRPLTTEELNQRKQQIQDQIVAATQTRLDDFARTRNYDSILSASTYATSPTAKFQQEGQYAVQARDATWAALYSILADVLAGTRPMPTGYEEIEPELPALVWPE